jgi:hypothetical protein
MLAKATTENTWNAVIFVAAAALPPATNSAGSDLFCAAVLQTINRTSNTGC